MAILSTVLNIGGNLQEGRMVMAKNKDNKAKSKTKTKNSKNIANMEVAEELTSKKKNK